MAELVVIVDGDWHRVVCTAHGPLPYVYADEHLAAYGAMGHATAHHGLGSTT